MRALTYHGPKDVRIDNVDDPTLQQDDDIILRVTATAICGSDLHLYRGKIPATEQGDIFGHEFMGIVEEAGPAVTAVKKGDRVVVPFVIACGECFFCQMDLTAACETTTPVAVRWSIKRAFRRGPPCLAIRTCTGACRVARPSMSACPRPTQAHLKCPARCPMKKCCS